MTTAYPLAWPDGWPRTPPQKRQDSKYRFRRTGRWSKSQSPFWSFAEARDALMNELERLGSRQLVLSTNYELRLDGLPRASGRTPDDTGIAVYFTLNGKQMVMACDMHLRAEENMRSIALAAEAMRQLERHGGGIMMERAFEGFQALPAPGEARKRHWREVLDLDGQPTADRIQAQFRSLSRERHPDAGGTAEAFHELQQAREEALREASS